MTEPATVVYLPGGQLVWAVQESRSVLLFDVRALKNPLTHVPHSGWVVTVPTVFVYLPGGHLV